MNPSLPYARTSWKKYSEYFDYIMSGVLIICVDYISPFHP